MPHIIDAKIKAVRRSSEDPNCEFEAFHEPVYVHSHKVYLIRYLLITKKNIENVQWRNRRHDVNKIKYK